MKERRKVKKNFRFSFVKLSEIFIPSSLCLKHLLWFLLLFPVFQFPEKLRSSQKTSSVFATFSTFPCSNLISNKQIFLHESFNTISNLLIQNIIFLIHNILISERKIFNLTLYGSSNFQVIQLIYWYFTK